MTTSGERPEDDGVHSFDLKSHQLSNVISGQGNYGQPVINEDATMIAFLTDKDDYVHKMPSWSLYLWDSKESTATSIVTHETKGMPKDWWIKSSVSPSFAEDSRRLTLDTAPIPEDRNKADEKKSDAEPKAKLDIWHWQDSSLQPMQLLRINQDKNRSYTAIYDLTKKTFIQLENKEMNRVSNDLRSSSDVAIGIASEQYDKIRSWDISGYKRFLSCEPEYGKSHANHENGACNSIAFAERKIHHLVGWKAEKVVCPFQQLKTESKNEARRFGQGNQISFG